MDNKNIRNVPKIKLLLITIASVVICTTAFAQPENITKNDDTDPNIQKTITVRHIDPNIAAKVVNQIIKLKIFQLPKETLIVPNREEKMLTVTTETPGQMKLIEEIVENIDFQIINEGTINKIYIPVTNLIFDEFYRIISPLLSKEGSLSYNITAETLVVTEITENQNNIENFIRKIDSYDFVDPNSTFDAIVVDLPKQADSNSIEVKAADSNDPMVAVQFSGFKIEHITERLKQWTGKDVIPSQEAMNLRVTIFSPQKMKRSEAIKLLYSAMIQQGFTTEETDSTIYIKPTPSTGDHIDIVSAADSLENIKNKDMVIRKIFQLKYSSPSIMGQLILPYLSSSGHFTAYDSIKTLMVGDTVKNLIQIEKMIEIFDSDPNSLPKGGVINPAIPDDPVIDVNLTNAGIHQIIETLIRWTGKAVLPSNEALGLKITLSSPEKIRQSEALRLLYIEIRKQSFIVEKRNNILYIKPAIIGSPYYQILSQDDSLEDIENLDMKARIIFKLKYNSPTKIQNILLPLLSPSANITPDETTKTLMIYDTVKKLKQFKEIIKHFDSEIPISDAPSELSAVKDPNEVIKIINQILNQQADSNSVPKDDVINTNDPNEKAQRQESDAVYVKYIDADIAVVKLKELLKEIEIDLTNRIIILPLATSKQILVFGKNENDRELAESLIHDIDYQAAENSYDFEKISLNHIEPEIFSKLVTNVLEEYRNLKLNLYPVVSSKQILLFGGKEYRNVVRKFAEKIDFQTSRLGTEYPNSPSLTAASDIFLKVFEIHNWNSVELAEMLNAIIKNKINKDFTTNLEADPIILIPWPQSNWIIVRASDESITFITEWVKMLESEYPDKIQNISLSEIEDPNQIVTKIYSIKHSSPGQLLQIIEPLISDKGDLVITEEEIPLEIIIRDRVSVLLQIEKIISDYDLQEKKKQKASSEPLVAIQFSSLRINQIIKSLTEWTGKRVVPSEEAKNLEIMVFTAEKLTRSNAAKLLYAAIRKKGFLVEET